MNIPAKILIVDDEEAIRCSLEELLSRDGYHVVAVESGESALDRIATQHFDLALLDLRMGGIGGLEVLAAIRQQSLDTAVIVLTGHGSMDTAIKALRQGAHDYLLKPTDTASLRESVRTALLKCEREQRQQALLQQVEQSLTASLEEIRSAVVQPFLAPVPPMASPSRQAAQCLQQGALLVDLAQHFAALDGNKLELSPTEFDVLAYLAQKAPAVVTPQELVQQVQGYECDRYEAGEIMRHYIYRIRQKAEACGGRAEFIRTVRGVGYALDV